MAWCPEGAGSLVGLLGAETGRPVLLLLLPVTLIPPGKHGRIVRGGLDIPPELVRPCHPPLAPRGPGNLDFALYARQVSPQLLEVYGVHQIERRVETEQNEGHRRGDEVGLVAHFVELIVARRGVVAWELFALEVRCRRGDETVDVGDGVCEDGEHDNAQDEVVDEDDKHLGLRRPV